MTKFNKEAIKRPSWHSIFMQLAESLATRSTCVKMKTGAVIVADTQIKSIGYNGTFEKDEECSDKWKKVHHKHIKMPYEDWVETAVFKDMHREWSKTHEIHAEANALKWITKGQADYVLYTLYSPCDACAKDIISYGIKKVYYKHLYKHGERALKRLRKYNIKCIQLL